MNIRYYYYRDGLRRPLITLCRLVVDGHTTYGWAICSARDVPHKGNVWFNDPTTSKDWLEPGGRSIALARARRALRSGRPCYSSVRALLNVRRYARPVVRDEACKVICLCQAHSFVGLVQNDSVDELPVSMQPPGVEESNGAR